MSANLVKVLVALTKVAPVAGNAAIVSTSVVVTDSSGVAQAAAILNGTESPTPWAFNTSVAPGAGTVVATDNDATGATVGTPVSQSFTEAGTTGGGGNTVTSAITVTPV